MWLPVNLIPVSEITLLIHKTLDMEGGLEQVDLWIQPLSQPGRSVSWDIALPLWAALSVMSWGEPTLCNKQNYSANAFKFPGVPELPSACSHGHWWGGTAIWSQGLSHGHEGT